MTIGRVAGNVALALALGAGGAALAAPAAGHATSGSGAAGRAAVAGVDGASLGLRSRIAYVRRGELYVDRGTSETKLTTGGGHTRPRWSPDGKRIAFLKNRQVWVMNGDGSGSRRLSTRSAAGPSWSPDGKWIAFASLSCTGGPGVYRVPATAADARPEVLFPRDCRGEDLPDEEPQTGGTPASLSERLGADDAVAWSPDGKRIAFRGGDCESTYDACLSIGTVSDGAEKTVAAYGGGSLQNRGFAVVPSWRADGAKLSFTAYQEGETAAEDEPVHVVEYDVASGAKRTVGTALDRELVYIDAARAVVTGQNAGASWVTVLCLETGKRTPFRSGSQPSVQPLPR